MTPSPLGAVLKKLRLQNGMSLRDLERAIGFSNAYIYQIECGKILCPSVEKIKAYASVFSVDPKLLIKLGDKSKEQRKQTGRLPGMPLRVKESFSAKNLTAAEETELLDYLMFIRKRESKRIRYATEAKRLSKKVKRTRKG